MSDLSDANKHIYQAFLTDPKSIADEDLRSAYQSGLADRDAPDHVDSPKWAAWSAGKQTRLNRAEV